MTWGVVIGGTISAVGTGLAANSNKKAAAKQNDANLLMKEMDNKYNREVFDESRGSKGAAVLPLYFGEKEKDMAGEFATSKALVNSQLGGSAGIVERLLASLAAADPAKQAATQTVNDAFAGKTRDAQLLELEGQLANRGAMGELLQEGVDERTGKQAVVADARTDLGGALSQAILAGSGGKEAALGDFAGTTTARNNLGDAFAKTLAERRGAAETINAADLQLAEAQAAGTRSAGNRNATQISESFKRNGVNGSTFMTSALFKAMADSNAEQAQARGEAQLRAAERLGAINPADADLYRAQLGEQTAGEQRQAAIEAAIARATSGERAAEATGASALQNAIEAAALPNSADAAFEGKRLIDDLFDKRSGVVASDEARRLSLLDKPYAMGDREADSLNSILRAIYAPQMMEQDALNFFRLGEGRAPSSVSSPAPVVAPGAGAAIGTALAGAGTKLAGNAIESYDWSKLFGNKN